MQDHRPRDVEFQCPFVDHFRCPEIMSPMREVPNQRERKLFTMLNRRERRTKSACPRCSVFIQQWEQHIGPVGHIRYFWKWLKSKELWTPRVKI